MAASKMRRRPAVRKTPEKVPTKPDSSSLSSPRKRSESTARKRTGDAAMPDSGLLDFASPMSDAPAKPKASKRQRNMTEEDWANTPFEPWPADEVQAFTAALARDPWAEKARDYGAAARLAIALLAKSKASLIASIMTDVLEDDAVTVRGMIENLKANRESMEALTGLMQAAELRLLIASAAVIQVPK